MRSPSIHRVVLIAGVCAVLSVVPAEVRSQPLVPNPGITVNVDTNANRRAIDPRIYGLAFAPPATITDLSIPINRWGGNTSTRYDWQTHWANLANDWCFYNTDESGGTWARLTTLSRLRRTTARSGDDGGPDDRLDREERGRLELQHHLVWSTEEFTV